MLHFNTVKLTKDKKSHNYNLPLVGKCGSFKQSILRDNYQVMSGIAGLRTSLSFITKTSISFSSCERYKPLQVPPDLACHECNSVGLFPKVMPIPEGQRTAPDHSKRILCSFKKFMSFPRKEFHFIRNSAKRAFVSSDIHSVQRTIGSTTKETFQVEKGKTEFNLYIVQN